MYEQMQIGSTDADGQHMTLTFINKHMPFLSGK
jgi:hypothetical protein